MGKRGVHLNDRGGRIFTYQSSSFVLLKSRRPLQIVYMDGFFLNGRIYGPNSGR